MNAALSDVFLVNLPKTIRETYEPICMKQQNTVFLHMFDCVGILPDGYVRTNPLPQIPTRQSVPTNKDSLPGYFGIPIAIPTLRSLIGPAISKVRTPWLSFH